MSRSERPPGAEEELSAVTSLAEPTRRAVYTYVVSVDGWVGRDQAAAALGLARGTAVHHLDRLASDGLLEVGFQRLSGRQGPGAGRPAKLYRRAHRDFEVSLPRRDYALAGRLLASAAERSRADHIDVLVALDEVARDEGRRIGAASRARWNSATGSALDATLELLEEQGFEPRTTQQGVVVLNNCPFHTLAREHTELVCGMNLALLDAVTEAAGYGALDARLEPADGVCCVRLHPVDGSAR